MPDHKITVPVGLSGRTAWEILDADGRTIRQGEFSNLILNSGLDAFAVSDSNNSNSSGVVRPYFSAWRQFLALGTGSTAPDVAQVALTNEVARTDSDGGFTSEIMASAVINAGVLTYTSTHVRVHTFASAYNITEYMFTRFSTGGQGSIRELFRDGNGNPTTLSPQAGQKIKVSHVGKITIPIGFADVAPNIANIGALNGRAGFWVANSAYAANLVRPVFDPMGGAYLYALRAADNNNSAAAPPSQVQAGSVTVQPYTNGTYRRVKRAVFAPGDANGNLYGLNLVPGGLSDLVGWRYAFNAPIAKDSTEQLTVDVAMTFGRG